MKKITLLFTLLTAASHAQSFPSPYCTITDADEVSVEEISRVDFGSDMINNSNDVDVLIDFTSTTGFAVSPGQTYSLKVYGNTYGNFDTDIVAFIDWNNNGVLDDSGETYPIGTLTNSTGSDGIFVDLDITVPTTATVGTTRVRITKTYTDVDSPAVIDPCAISFDAFGMGIFAGFGQALDFNIVVNALSNPTFDSQSLRIFPMPTKDILNITYKSAIGNIQVYNQLGQEMYTKSNLGSEVALDVSNFANGIYVVKIFNDSESKTFKIVKK